MIIFIVFLLKIFLLALSPSNLDFNMIMEYSDQSHAILGKRKRDSNSYPKKKEKFEKEWTQEEQDFLKRKEAFIQALKEGQFEDVHRGFYFVAYRNRLVKGHQQGDETLLRIDLELLFVVSRECPVIDLKKYLIWVIEEKEWNIESLLENKVSFEMLSPLDKSEYFRIKFIEVFVDWNQKWRNQVTDVSLADQDQLENQNSQTWLNYQRLFSTWCDKVIPQEEQEEARMFFKFITRQVEELGYKNIIELFKHFIEKCQEKRTPEEFWENLSWFWDNFVIHLNQEQEKIGYNLRKKMEAKLVRHKRVEREYFVAFDRIKKIISERFQGEKKDEMKEEIEKMWMNTYIYSSNIEEQTQKIKSILEILESVESLIGKVKFALPYGVTIEKYLNQKVTIYKGVFRCSILSLEGIDNMKVSVKSIPRTCYEGRIGTLSTIIVFLQTTFSTKSFIRIFREEWLIINRMCGQYIDNLRKKGKDLGTFEVHVRPAILECLSSQGVHSFYQKFRGEGVEDEYMQNDKPAMKLFLNKEFNRQGSLGFFIFSFLNEYENYPSLNSHIRGQKTSDIIKWESLKFAGSQLDCNLSVEDYIDTEPLLEGEMSPLVKIHWYFRIQEEGGLVLRCQQVVANKDILFVKDKDSVLSEEKMDISEAHMWLRKINVLMILSDDQEAVSEDISHCWKEVLSWGIENEVMAKEVIRCLEIGLSRKNIQGIQEILSKGDEIITSLLKYQGKGVLIRCTERWLKQKSQNEKGGGEIKKYQTTIIQLVSQVVLEKKDVEKEDIEILKGAQFILFFYTGIGSEYALQILLSAQSFLKRVEFYTRLIQFSTKESCFQEIQQGIWVFLKSIFQEDLPVPDQVTDEYILKVTGGIIRLFEGIVVKLLANSDSVASVGEIQKSRIRELRILMMKYKNILRYLFYKVKDKKSFLDQMSLLGLSDFYRQYWSVEELNQIDNVEDLNQTEEFYHCFGKVVQYNFQNLVPNMVKPFNLRSAVIAMDQYDKERKILPWDQEMLDEEEEEGGEKEKVDFVIRVIKNFNLKRRETNEWQKMFSVSIIQLIESGLNPEKQEELLQALKKLIKRSYKFLDLEIICLDLIELSLKSHIKLFEDIFFEILPIYVREQKGSKQGDLVIFRYSLEYIFDQFQSMEHRQLIFQKILLKCMSLSMRDEISILFNFYEEIYEKQDIEKMVSKSFLEKVENEFSQILKTNLLINLLREVKSKGSFLYEFVFKFSNHILVHYVGSKDQEQSRLDKALQGKSQEEDGELGEPDKELLITAGMTIIILKDMWVGVNIQTGMGKYPVSLSSRLSLTSQAKIKYIEFLLIGCKNLSQGELSPSLFEVYLKEKGIPILILEIIYNLKREERKKACSMERDVFERFIKENSEYVVNFLDSLIENNFDFKTFGKQFHSQVPAEIHYHVALKKKKNKFEIFNNSLCYIDKKQLKRILEKKEVYKEFFTTKNLMLLSKESFEWIEEESMETMVTEESETTEDLIKKLIQMVIEFDSRIISPVEILNNLGEIISYRLLGDYGIEQIRKENSQFQAVDLCDRFLSWELTEEDQLTLIKELLKVVVEKRTLEKFTEVQQKLLSAGDRFSVSFVEGLIEEKRKNIFYEWLKNNIDGSVKEDHFDIFEFMCNHTKDLIKDKEKLSLFTKFISSFAENDEKYAKILVFFAAWTHLMEWTEDYEKKHLERFAIEFRWREEELLKMGSGVDVRLWMESSLKNKRELYWIDEIREILFDIDFKEEDLKKRLSLLYENYKETGEGSLSFIKWCQFLIKGWHDQLELLQWDPQMKIHQEKRILKAVSDFWFILVENPEEKVISDEQFAFFVYMRLMNQENLGWEVCTLNNIQRVEIALQESSAFSLQMVQVLEGYLRSKNLFVKMDEDREEKGRKRKYGEVQEGASGLEETPLKKVKEEEELEEVVLERDFLLKKENFVSMALNIKTREKRVDAFKYFNLGHKIDFVVEVMDYLFNQPQYTVEKFYLLCDMLSVLDQSLVKCEDEKGLPKEGKLSGFFIFLFEAVRFSIKDFQYKEEVLRVGLISMYHIGLSYQDQSQEMLSEERLKLMGRITERENFEETHRKIERLGELWNDLNLHWLRWRNKRETSQQLDECIVAMMLFFIKDTRIHTRASEEYIKKLEDCQQKTIEEIRRNRETVLEKVEFESVLKYEISFLKALKQRLKKYNCVAVNSIPKMESMKELSLEEHFKRLFQIVQLEYKEYERREIPEKTECKVMQLIHCLLQVSFEDQKSLLEETIGKSADQRIRYDIFKKLFFFEEISLEKSEREKASRIMELLIFDEEFILDRLKFISYIKGKQRDYGIILVMIFFERIVDYRNGSEDDLRVKLMIVYLYGVMCQQDHRVLLDRMGKRYNHIRFNINTLIAEMVRYQVKSKAREIWELMDVRGADLKPKDYFYAKGIIIRGIANVLAEGEFWQPIVQESEYLDNESLEILVTELKEKNPILKVLCAFDQICSVLTSDEIELTGESLKGNYSLLTENEMMESTSAMLIGRSALMTTKESIKKQQIGQASYKKVDETSRLKEAFYQKLTAGCEVYLQKKETIRLPQSLKGNIEREVLASNSLKEVQGHYFVHIRVSSFIYELAIEVGLNEKQYLLLMDFILVNELIQAKIKKSILEKGLTLSKEQLLNIESLSLIETFRFLKKYQGVSFSEVKKVLKRIAEKGKNKFYVERDSENGVFSHVKASEIEKRSIVCAYNLALQRSKERRIKECQRFNRLHLNKDIQTLLISA